MDTRNSASLTSARVAVRALVGWSLLSIIIACGSGTSPDSFTSSGVVYGQVRDARGQPVEGATVEVTAYGEQRCGEETYRAGSSPAWTTRTDGKFRLEVISPLSPRRACLVVVVSPPSSSNLESKTLSEVELDLTADYQREAPPDSIQVDLVLDET